MLLGFLLVFVGMAIIVVGGLIGEGGEANVAVGGFIGPIPFGFANNSKMLKLLYVVLAAVFIFFFAVPVVMRYILK